MGMRRGRAPTAVRRGRMRGVGLLTPWPLTVSNITSEGADVTWSAVSGAQDYVVQYSAAPDFATLIGNDTISTSGQTTVTLTNGDSGTRYYVRVAASPNANGKAQVWMNGAWSPPISFTTS